MAVSGRHVTVPVAGLAATPPSWARLVLAPNPGPMTLDGTNTWVLGVAGQSERIVVDPGPRDEAHLRRAGADPVALVLVTHGHPDHTDGLDRFTELTGAPVRARDSRWCRKAPPLADGEVIDVAGLRVRVLAVPGHTADSVAFVVTTGGSETSPAGSTPAPGAGGTLSPGPEGIPSTGEPAVVTGDTLLGRGTTVVAWPDGNLGDYLESLRKLRELGAVPVLPGHGPALADCLGAADFYLRHRLERLEQVRRAVEAGARTASDVVPTVYADVDRSLWPAAEMSVRAQLAYLDAAGRVPTGSEAPS